MRRQTSVGRLMCLCRLAAVERNGQNGLPLNAAANESTDDYSSITAYVVVAMGHTDHDYEVWTHRDAAHAYRKRRRQHSALTLASDHAFWSYSKPQAARTTSRGVGSGALVSIHTVPPHTAAEAVGGGPRGRRDGPGDPCHL